MGILISTLILLSTSSWAHPVTFEGGTMLRSIFRQDMGEVSASYSFHRLLSVGLEVDTLMVNSIDTNWYFATFNMRPFRWNTSDSQSNIYLTTAAGGYKDKWREDIAGKAGIQLDHETRRFYSMLKYQRWFTKNFETDMTMMQLGFAPFTAGYNDLHIWALVQLDYNKDMRKYTQVTPMLRFFYKNVFWEAGGSFSGNFYGSMMVHF